MGAWYAREKDTGMCGARGDQAQLQLEEDGREAISTRAVTGGG